MPGRWARASDARFRQPHIPQPPEPDVEKPDRLLPRRRRQSRLRRRARDGESPFGVVRGFADPPLVFRIPHVSGDYRAGGAFETSDAMGIPMEHLVMRQHLRLLAYGVTGSDALEAADDAIGYSDRHR